MAYLFIIILFAEEKLLVSQNKDITKCLKFNITGKSHSQHKLYKIFIFHNGAAAVFIHICRRYSWVLCVCVQPLSQSISVNRSADNLNRSKICYHSNESLDMMALIISVKLLECRSRVGTIQNSKLPHVLFLCAGKLNVPLVYQWFIMKMNGILFLANVFKIPIKYVMYIYI